jgi:imidazolonepropionase-like amidohydrolase
LRTAFATDVDDEFMALITQRPGVFVIPNLPERDAADDFAWLADTVPAAEIQRLRSALGARSPAAAQQARELYGVQARNLARLDTAGARIGFGTDAGVSVGWTAHTELADMVAAGMSPARVLVAATKTSAEILGLHDLGTIAPGKRADFMVLDGNPVDDIRHTRRIAAVYLGGRAIDRSALSAEWTGGRPD